MTTNLVNGKRYIGRDSNNKPHYYGSGTAIKKALKKYGKHNFKKEILEHCDNTEKLQEEKVNRLKNDYIDLIKKLQIIFQNDEEFERYKNIDITSNTDLSIAIPLYARKLKDIALFYNKKRQELKDKNKTNIHCYSPLNEVIDNFKKNTLNAKNLICIKGPVERTLINKNKLPKKISILRLDTDFYESTKIELEVLFPLLENNGILIIDDYGCWQGAKKAVDEYFLNKKFTMFKIDITGRFIIKNNL
jgi:hypothetical protein